jgi:hypothetical protein
MLLQPSLDILGQLVVSFGRLEDLVRGSAKVIEEIVSNKECGVSDSGSSIA